MVRSGQALQREVDDPVPTAGEGLEETLDRLVARRRPDLHAEMLDSCPVVLFVEPIHQAP